MSEHVPEVGPTKRKWVEQEELLTARLVIAKRNLEIYRAELVEVLRRHPQQQREEDIQEATRKAADSSLLVEKLTRELEEVYPF